jgi:uncharacterized membrane protein
MIFILFILIVIAVAIGLIVWILKITRKHGYGKLGIVASILIAGTILFIPMTFLLEDLLFTKSDAIKQLSEHNIILRDDYKLESKEISGIMDYTLQFELSISDSDKNRIIKDFKTSKYLIKNEPHEMFDIRPRQYISRNSDTVMYAVYEETNFWNLQYCKVLTNGYVQTWDIIQIPKDKNKINYIRNQ